MKLKIAFLGTSEFAVMVLRRLVEVHEVGLCICQPDKPQGRGHKMRAMPVKVWAEECGIEVRTPSKLRAEELGDLVDFDLLVTASYGLLIPNSVLKLNQRPMVNVHPSLLPRWRGAAPIQHSILAGDVQTGVCLMKVVKALDAGGVFASVSTPIGEEETAGELHDRLAEMGGDLLVENIERIYSGESVAVEQDDELSTYANKWTKEDSKLSFDQDAAKVQRRIRAGHPYVPAWTVFRGKRMLIHRSRLATDLNPQERNSGILFSEGKSRLGVSMGKSSAGLEILELQLEGKKRTDAKSFLAGFGKIDGEILG